MPTLPLTRDLVLVGGGHAHALVLLDWAMNPLPGARLTLITQLRHFARNLRLSG